MMKALTRFSLLFSLSALPLLAAAQTEVNTLNDISWNMMSNWINGGIFDVSATYSSGSPLCEGISTGRIRIDDNSVIAPYSQGNNNFGVLRINRDMGLQWQSGIEGYPQAIGMFNGNVLLVAATEASSWKGPGNTYVGFLLDPKTGRLLAKKELFVGGEFYQQPVFLFAPDGSSFKIAVRVSNFTRGVHNPLLSFNMNKVAGEYFDTKDFTLIKFDKDLNAQSPIKPKLPEGYFLGGTTNKNSDVFLLSDVSQGYIKVTQYADGKTTPLKTLQQAVDINDDVMKNLQNFFMFTSKTDPLVIFFAGLYQNSNKDPELVVAKFNFRDGTVVDNVQSMDKDYQKNLEKSWVPFSKKFDSADLGYRDNLKIKDVLENNGKLVVALSSYSTYNSGNHITFRYHDVLVNMYDEKTGLQFQQIIPRTYQSDFILIGGVDMHVKDDKLYLVANNNKGFIGYKALFAEIDLKTGATLNITGIEKSQIKNAYPVNPYSTCWFGSQFILSYIQEKGFFEDVPDAHLQLLNY